MNMYHEAQVCVGTLLSGACWLAGMGLICLCCADLLPVPYAVLGLAIIIGGALHTVCSRLDLQERRERNAFHLGRDSVMHVVRE